MYPSLFPLSPFVELPPVEEDEMVLIRSCCTPAQDGDQRFAPIKKTKSLPAGIGINNSMSMVGSTWLSFKPVSVETDERFEKVNCHRRQEIMPAGILLVDLFGS